MTRFALFVLLLAACGDEDLGSPTPEFPPGIAFGPQVCLVEPDSAVIAWRTEEPCTGAVEVSGRVVEGARGTDHAVRIDGLSPDSLTPYRLRLDGRAVEREYAVRTPPVRGRLVFAVIGDGGAGNEAQRDVAHAMERLDLHAVLYAGDLAYPHGEARSMRLRHFVPYDDLLARVPFFCVLGNHDVETDGGRAILDMLVLPRNDMDGTERYYAFSWGHARFLALDSEQSLVPGSPQHEWLSRELAGAESDWTFVFLHRAIYSSSSHGSDPQLQASLCPLFEERGVDLVFSGHDHDFERTFPIAAGEPDPAGEPDYIDPGGVIYVVTGGAGKRLYPNGASAFTAASRSAHHFTLVEVDGPRLVFSAVRPDGAVFDRMTIEKTR